MPRQGLNDFLDVKKGRQGKNVIPSFDEKRQNVILFRVIFEKCDILPSFWPSFIRQGTGLPKG